METQSAGVYSQVDLNATQTFGGAYKEDWQDSIVYKAAMKAEAIKRGLSYAEFDFEEDEDDRITAQQESQTNGDGTQTF